MIVGACAWVKTWYVVGCEVRVPLATFEPATLSLAYGDSFPAMRFRDGRPYRGQVYTVGKLPELARLYGLPQVWNRTARSGLTATSRPGVGR
jgi:hypothetical protein